MCGRNIPAHPEGGLSKRSASMARLEGPLIRRAVLVDEAIIGGPHHVDVGIAAAGILAATNADEGAVLTAFVAQMVTVGVALGPGGAVAGAQHCLSIVLDEHSLAGKHHEKLVL